MFDTYLTRPAHTEYVTKNVNITEKRAPTDESVRLLREMEAKAQEQIVRSTRVNNCQVDIVIHRMYDFINCQHKFIAVYTLNGAKQEVRYEHRDALHLSEREQREAVTSGLRDAIGKHLATSMLVSLGTSIEKMLFD